MQRDDVVETQQMLVNYVLDTKQLREELAPYSHALEAHGIDERRLIGYALKLLHSEDYTNCRKVIESDLIREDFHNLIFTPEKFDRLTHTCMDAVGEIVAHLTPQVTNLVGALPRSLHLKGFAGEDPVVGVEYYLQRPY